MIDSEATGRTINFVVDGRDYTATYIRRPFREGLEVQCEVGGEVISVAEFGFGEAALIERLTSMVREKHKNDR